MQTNNNTEQSPLGEVDSLDSIIIDPDVERFDNTPLKLHKLNEHYNDLKQHYKHEIFHSWFPLKPLVEWLKVCSEHRAFLKENPHVSS